MANEWYQQNKSDRLDSWASSDMERYSASFQVTWLFHNATVSQCNHFLLLHMYLLFETLPGWLLGWRVFFFFFLLYFFRVWVRGLYLVGEHSAPMYLLFGAIYWSLGRRGYLGASNITLVTTALGSSYKVLASQDLILENVAYQMSQAGSHTWRVVFIVSIPSVYLLFSIFMPPPLGARGIMFLGCPSIRLKPEIPSFHLYMGPLVHPTNRYCFTACPSVRRGFRAFTGERMEWMAWNFALPLYLDHLQNWLDYGHSLLIFLCLTPLWLSEMGQIWGFWAFPREGMGGNGLKMCTLMYLDHLQNWFIYAYSLVIFLTWTLFWLSEKGQIWGLWAFPGERMDGMASNFACWCNLTTFRTD